MSNNWQFVFCLIAFVAFVLAAASPKIARLAAWTLTLISIGLASWVFISVYNTWDNR